MVFVNGVLRMIFGRKVEKKMRKFWRKLQNEEVHG
jgi:hypothetical protein